MVRSRLRADQIRDPDLLTEAEHAALVHQNLTTSGILNFQDGTISGTGDVYATTYYGDGSQLSGISTNPESLYYNGTDIKATAIAAGISITDGTATAATLEFSSDDLHIVNNDPDGTIQLRARKSDDSQLNTMATFDPDAGAWFGYDGTTVFRTFNGYVQVYDSGGSSPFRINADSNTSQLYNFVHGGKTALVGESDSGSAVNMAILDPHGSWTFSSRNTADDATNTLMILDPDGAAELYYAGSKVLETLSNGCKITSGTDIGQFYFASAGRLEIKNFTHGGDITLRAENNAGANTAIVSGDPDGKCVMFYAGTQSIESTSTGLTAYGSGGLNPIALRESSGNWVLDSSVHGGQIQLQGEDEAGSGKILFIADPDGASSMYYNGIKRIETGTTGDGSIAFFNDSAEQLSLYYDGTEWQFYNYIHGSPIWFRGENNSGTITTLLTMDPDNYHSIYHAGSKVWESSPQGFDIYGDTSARVTFYSAPNNFTIRTRSSSPAIFYLKGDGSAVINRTLVAADPDGAVELYYAGVKKVETADYGLSFGANTISGTGDIYCNDIHTATGSVYLGNLKLSSTDGETLLVNDEELQAGTTSGTGASTFTELTDTPSSYTGTEGQVPVSTGSGVNFNSNWNFGTNISGSGNIYAGYYYGNASNLTGITLSGSISKLQDGDSFIQVVDSGNGQIDIQGDGVQVATFTADGAVISGSVTADAFYGEVPLPIAYINGLILSNGTDSDHDIDIASGKARSEDDSVNMTVASGITKQIDAAWTVGTDAGGLFSGSVASDTTYHIFVIKNPTTGVVDAGFDTDLNATNRPAAYTKYRRIGSLYTDGSSNLVQFNQFEDEFILDDPVQSLFTSSMGTSAVLRTCAVPIGLSLRANINWLHADVSPSTAVYSLASSPYADDIDPSASNGRPDIITTTGTDRGSISKLIRTNTSGQIRTRVSATAADIYGWLITFGWIDSRGKQ